MDANQEVWPIRVNPGVNRGYRPGQLREDGRLHTYTAACSPHVYRGDQFPAEFYGNVFVAEPAGNFVRRSVVSEDDGILTGRNAYDHREFLASTDERFRPVGIYTGPDGALYVVDMYHGVIQHKQFVTSFLRRQIVERGLDNPSGVGQGRIYRVVHEGKPLGAPPALSSQTSKALVKELQHPNGWRRDAAQRILVERADRSVWPELRRLALDEANSDPVRLHALWAMEGLEVLDETTVRKVLKSASPKLRAAAVRLSEPFLAKPGELPLDNEVLALADDPTRQVRLQVAFSLGEARPARDEVLARLAWQEREDPWFSELVAPALLSSLAGREVEFLERLVADEKWQDRSKAAEELLSLLAAVVMRQGESSRIDRLFATAAGADRPDWMRSALISGARQSGVRFLEDQPGSLTQLAGEGKGEVAQDAGRLLDYLVWPGKYAEGPPPLTDGEQALFERGRTDFQQICAGCHQQDGRGLTGIAPSLVNSRWVLGPESLPISIVLKGKESERLAMPPLESLSNSQIAGILTYIRRSWNHGASAVSPNTVGNFRSALINRGQPFTDPEMEQLLGER